MLQNINETVKQFRKKTMKKIILAARKSIGKRGGWMVEDTFCCSLMDAV